MRRTSGKVAVRSFILHPSSLILSLVALALLGTTPAQAALVTWNGFSSNSDWANGNNWSTGGTAGTAPGTGDMAEFGPTWATSGGLSAANGYAPPLQPTIALAETANVGGLQVDAGMPVSVLTIGGAGTLQLGVSGITVSSNAGAVNINTSVIVGASQTWTNNGNGGIGGGLTVGGKSTSAAARISSRSPAAAGRRSTGPSATWADWPSMPPAAPCTSPTPTTVFPAG
jgi:hypothetical protein